ncbi:MAG: hypothetical protein ACJ8LN_03685 [Sulfurifustis sp.]
MTAPATDLIWRGRETIEAATAALAQASDVALHLPAELHHAVAMRLGVDVLADHVEGVNVTGGPELISRLSGIRGLEPLVALVPSIEQARARVQVLSPSPTVAIRCAGSEARPT